MNWYIAICSLVTGFVLGIICAKWADVQHVKNQLTELIRLYIKANDVVNRNFGRLFDINREILKTHLEPKEYYSALKRIEDNVIEEDEP